MRITKTTINMAARRNMAITIIENDSLRDGRTSVEFAALQDGEAADEHAAVYDLHAMGMFFIGGCGDTEEWPNWIPDEATLRTLLPAMAEAV
jgi:hypothetical protein